jgi:hypothetical protein
LLRINVGGANQLAQEVNICRNRIGEYNKEEYRKQKGKIRSKKWKRK